jgi:hypothetical protein
MYQQGLSPYEDRVVGMLITNFLSEQTHPGHSLDFLKYSLGRIQSHEATESAVESLLNKGKIREVEVSDWGASDKGYSLPPIRIFDTAKAIKDLLRQYEAMEQRLTYEKLEDTLSREGHSMSNIELTMTLLEREYWLEGYDEKDPRGRNYTVVRELTPEERRMKRAKLIP